MKLIKTTKQEVLFVLLLVLVGISFFGKLNQSNFIATLTDSFIVVALFVYFFYYLKVKISTFFKVVVFFFFASSFANAFNESNLYIVNQFFKYLPQFLLLFAYFGLIYYSLLRLKRFKFKEITNLYLMIVLLINIVLTVVFVNIIIGNINEVLQEYIIYVYCFISIILGFTSFAAFNQDGLKESFLFTAMALSFIFSDTQYTLNHFFMSSIIFEIGDVILTTLGLYFMFSFIYQKQLVAEDLELEKKRLLEVEKQKAAMQDFAIRL